MLLLLFVSAVVVEEEPDTFTPAVRFRAYARHRHQAAVE